MGRFKSVSDCAFCEKANDEEKRKDISIWVLCGAAGSGKTSLFNALTGVEAPTGDGSETKSLNSQTIAYCLEPLPCYLEKQSHLLLVDSEGTNGVIFNESKENRASRYVTMLKNSLIRFRSGATGIILCFDFVNKRFDDHTKTFLECLSENLKDCSLAPNIVLCFTKCNLNPKKSTNITTQVASWYHHADQSSLRHWLKALNHNQEVPIIATSGEFCEETDQWTTSLEDIANLANKLSELTGVCLARGGQHIIPTVNIDTATHKEVEQKVERAFLKWYQRNPILNTLLKTNARAILSTVFSPVLLALSPLLVPAALMAHFTNENQRRLALVNRAAIADVNQEELVQQGITPQVEAELVSEIYEEEIIPPQANINVNEEERLPTPVKTESSSSEANKSACSIQ